MRFHNITYTARLAKVLRSVRRERGFTQAEVAERAGVSRSWLIEFESGKPTVEVGKVMSVVRALGVCVEIASPIRTGGHDFVERHRARLPAPTPARSAETESPQSQP